jgi:hypothetical protein
VSALREFQQTTTAKVDLSLLNPFFWTWYKKHLDDVVLKRKILILTLNIRVRDIRPLFVMLFGEEGNIELNGVIR